jgi:hypothetical protein
MACFAFFCYDINIHNNMEIEQKNNNLYLILIIFCLISFLGALIYRFYTLNTFSILVILASTALFTILLKRNFKLKFCLPKLQHYLLNDWLLVFIYLCLFGGATLLAVTKATDLPIVSPWSVLGWEFFGFYFLATLLIIWSALKKSQAFNLLIVLHFWLSCSVAFLIYKIGYGFDPFIHQASVAYIDDYGPVLPKTIYYIGQYSLIDILHKITMIPITVLDKLLVPLAAALLLPITANYVFSQKFKHEIGRKLLVLFLLLLPYSLFIVTTPQNLAYLLLIIMIMLGLIVKKRIDWIMLYLLALTCFFIHPIAGLPAISFAALLTVKQSRLQYKQVFYVLAFIFNIVILPIAFLWVAKLQNPQAVLSHLFDFSSITLVGLQYPHAHNWALNFVYLIQQNFGYLLLFFILLGLYFAYTRKKYRHYPCNIYFNQSLAFFISYLFTRNLSFGYLIDYERQNYADRVLVIACLFALPFVIIAIYHLILRIIKQENIVRYTLLLTLAGAVTASLYLSYPRLDDYFNAHGYATSSNDIATVQWIDNDAGGKDYIVLANQQVSAAALHEYGFAHYYAWRENNKLKQVFYYPVPTGGDLYQYYLKMADQEATAQTMHQAMTLAGVNTAYYVLNSYWWTFDKNLKEGKLSANSYQMIGNKNIYIFKYTK